MNRKLILLVLLSAVTLQACLGGLKKKDPEEEPAELTKLEDGVTIKSAWSTKLGGGAEHLSLGLKPASDGNRIFAASHSGVVSGLDLVTGKRDWSHDTDLALTAGPGYGDGLIIVGSADGDVVAIDAVTGERRWSQVVSGELLAVPVIYSGVVIVRAVNGKIFALEARNGALRWTVEQSVPRLSLRGNGQPAAARDRVIVGFDNGRVVALSLRDGADLWQAPLASGRGRTELDRMTDIDSNVVIVGEEVYVAGFQSRAALLMLGDGQAAWAEQLSSAGGLAADWTALYATSGDGHVYALERASGKRLWEQSGLLRRGLTGPTPFGEAVVVGDFEGFLHWLSARDGSIIGRARAGSARIAAQPLAVGERLIVQDEAGILHAFTMPQSSAP
ncbi:MAG: outer membrane protein assembly factor BamB [Gammaproteobacteria bacterium]|nr:outer membrane protein assembly factor BamB [Gammaproteobacteria bacterium]